jgi:ferredoxin
MDEKDLAFHYVCTREKARQIAGRHHRFWVSNCGCREKREQCSRSRIDVCLMFRDDIAGSGGSGKREISFVELEEIFQEAKEKHLVTRPFRNEKNMAQTDGICFCCDDCCEYFLNPSENKCDKGEFIERTDRDGCTNCGICVEVCYFGARKMDGEKLTLDRDNCYGCGLCVDVCPEDCVETVTRE